MAENKDEALRCIDIGQQFKLGSGYQDEAIHFLQKAEKLYPTPKAKKLLEELMNSGDTSYQFSEPTSSTQAEYTEDQLQYVLRIVRCKYNYEILNVPKEATYQEIGTAYRKLALQLHSDKNKAPGADKAFDALSKAKEAMFKDIEKRKQDDLSCSNKEQKNSPGHSHSQQDNTRGFEADKTAEAVSNWNYTHILTGAALFVGGCAVGYIGARIYQQSKRRLPLTSGCNNSSQSSSKPSKNKRPRRG